MRTRCATGVCSVKMALRVTAKDRLRSTATSRATAGHSARRQCGDPTSGPMSLRIFFGTDLLVQNYDLRHLLRLLADAVFVGLAIGPEALRARCLRGPGAVAARGPVRCARTPLRGLREPLFLQSELCAE